MGANATLAESGSNGIDVHLFEVIDAGEYIYCGRIEFVCKPYTDIQPGEDGNVRNVWMFPIKPVPDNDVKSHRCLYLMIWMTTKAAERMSMLNTQR